MEQIKIGVMLPGAQLFNDQNVNPTWKAHVKTHEKVIVAFVKQISLHKLYVECVCAIIGRYIGLPIPKPIIVKVTNENFSGIPVGQFRLAFGSEDAAYPSFRRYINSNEQLAMTKLIEFSRTLDIAVFDEWIGNWDRNQGNILYDGGNHFSFIDHENAIDPNLAFDSAARANIIIDAIYSSQSEFEKYKVNRNVKTSIIPQYEKFPFSLISDKTYATSYLSDEEVLSVISFLENRIIVLEKLFAKRLNLKQQEMAI
ncbi:HipA family kinase [Colwellia sp. 20A7]|uniref:HipA family kinase n=1 Tax=Colwellia sp. 20A7 TaxID=2689569 RepID=UPI0013592AD4|nr:HipA family kinase [Colwellia sp. 20A7]